MNRYPTDEELRSFIEELEKGELYAPRHLKEEILLKARAQEKPEKAGRGSQQPVSFLIYSLKMVAGMAAAIILVFMIPAGNGSNVSKAGLLEKEWSASEEWEEENDSKKISLDEKISAHMNKKREEADELFRKINHLLLSYDDLGGDYNEN